MYNVVMDIVQCPPDAPWTFQLLSMALSMALYLGPLIGVVWSVNFLSERRRRRHP